MLVYIILLLVVCAISYLFQYFTSKKVLNGLLRSYQFNISTIGMVLVFLILAFFSMARDGIGIDYESYYMHIGLIQKGSPHYMEIGFKLFVRFLARFSTNPRWVIVFMSFFTCLFYMLVIIKWSEDKTLSIFLFLTWGYYFFSFNTVRNYFAYSLALFSLIFLAEKKYIRFLICLIIAASFHKSALVCIPLYLLATRSYKRKYVLYIVCLTILALVYKQLFQRFFYLFYGKYEGSVYDTGRVSWLNIIKALAVVGIGFVFYEHIENDIINRICFNLNVFALVFYIGFYWTPEISRIGFYMNTSAIILIPRLLSRIHEIDRGNRIIVKLSIVLGSSLLFYLLMRGWYSSRILLLPYRTWIGGSF